MVLVIDRTDPEHYAEVRGRVVAMVTGQPALDHADRLSRRYSGEPYRGPMERVVMRIRSFRQVIRTNPRRR